MLYSTNYSIGIPKYLTYTETVYFILNNISLINENYHLKVPDDILNLNIHTFICSSYNY